METYALGILEIYGIDGKKRVTLSTKTNIDNTAGNGVQTIYFDTEETVGDNETYRAYIWSSYDDAIEQLPEENGGKQLSSIYEPSEIEIYLLSGENSETEDFNYYGKTTLTESGTWIFGGTAGRDFSLGRDDNVTYTRIMSDGTKNGKYGSGSFYLMRKLENLDEGTGCSGRYMIDINICYLSGSGLNFAFAKDTTSKTPFIKDEFVAFTIGDDGTVMAEGTKCGTVGKDVWTNIEYILDMDAGTASISVGGADAVEVEVPYYSNIEGPEIDTLKHFVIEGQGVAFDVRLSSLTLAKLKNKGDR